MQSDQSTSSSTSSNPSGPAQIGEGTEGPMPLPEESPFLSDHGMGSPAPPPTARLPVEPPSGLSQFPALPSGSGGVRASSASQAILRGAVAPDAAPPIPGYGAVVKDSISSFPMFLAAGAAEDPFGPSLRGSGAIPDPGSPNSELFERLRGILVTTTDSLQGRVVEQYLGVVTAEAVVPTDTLLEGAERMGRFSRYKSSQQKVKSLQQLVMAELKLESDKLGGNAVLGAQLKIALDHGVFLVSASGTAVRVG